MKSRGVFLKLMGAFLLVIVAATITLGFSVRRAWERSMREEIVRELTDKTNLFAVRVRNNRGQPLNQLVAEEAEAANARATIIDSSGKVIADSEADAETMENHSHRPEFIRALQGGIGTAERQSATIGVPFLYVAAPIPGGALRMAYPLSSVRQITEKINRSLALGGAVALVVSILLAYFIAHLVVQRLRRIVAFAERIRAGDLAARIDESSGDEIAMVAAALDRTARALEQSFRQLETSRKQLETLLNSMHEAVIAVGADANVLWVNARLKQLLGPGVRLGSPAVQTVRDPSFLSAIETAISRNSTCVARATALLPGRVFQITAAPMPPAGAVAVLHDLSAIERVEKTRRDFIANVSHELRTPLTAVQGYTETLLDSIGDKDPNTHEFLEIILKNAARMTRLTEDLLALARVESGEHRFDVRPISASDVLNEAAETLASAVREAGMELSIEDSSSEDVLADPEAMHQVLSNLIRNAINYACGGGRIVIGARPIPGFLQFYVRDFGPGIASEHLPRLFERFYRVDKARSRESGGTGLGLAIVKHIVQAHGGEVRAESELGHGATFYFTLPLAGPETESPAGTALFIEN